MSHADDPRPDERISPLLNSGSVPVHSLCFDLSVLFQVKPPTGEPCAGDPHARFGGEGDRELNRSSLPLSLLLGNEIRINYHIQSSSILRTPREHCPPKHKS